MSRIYIGGAGGAPSNNVIKSLRAWRDDLHLIGGCADPGDLLLADVDEHYLVPMGNDPAYADRLLTLLDRTKPDFLHVQNDVEVLAVSRLRPEIEARGVRIFMPSEHAVETLVDKWRSYEVWHNAGLRVPRTVLINGVDDLRNAFDKFDGKVWLRAAKGAGGAGALPTDDFDFGRLWIDRYSGWGTFTAAERLTSRSVTWLSLWHEGRLLVAQTRLRHAWSFASRALSGVTGVTAVGETASSEEVTELAQQSILAADPVPHGIYGVDMTYGEDGLPYLTEINVARFFTTIFFFTRAGLNMPAMYADIGLGNPAPEPVGVNPLPDGLMWIRGMDVEPVLATRADFDALGLDG